MNYKEYFKGKKITVIGLGILGRGVGDIKFLAEHGAVLTVTDLKTKEDLVSSLEQLKEYDITYSLGGHKLDDFRSRDLIIKAAGIPLDSPFIAEAEKNNILVKMSTSLFAKFFPGTIIGVTGTRGKSTVTAMIYEILKAAGKKVFLGGNVKGVSTLAHLPKSTPDEIAVLELDSWQLQGFGEEKISPHIAVFTTFFPDHLNYYKGDLNAYLKDKSYIFSNQKENDFLILGSQCAGLIKDNYESKARVLIGDSKDLPSDWNLKILGEHNRYNATLAMLAVESLNIDRAIVKSALESFSGVPGRLEFMKEIKGIKIYNDTTSTTPEATIAALEALGNEGKKNIVLIFGGNDKGLNLTGLLDALPRFCKKIFVVPGSGSDRLPTEIDGLGLERVRELKESLERSFKVANSGDIILFSPAFTSFGQFKNEFDRGEKFVDLVNQL